jgi:hypothetical protein
MSEHATEHAADSLRAALRELQASSHGPPPDVLGQLRVRVCAMVDELKAGGMLPEHVVLAIKSIAKESMPGGGRRSLVDQMVAWCVAHYFRESVA